MVHGADYEREQKCKAKQAWCCFEWFDAVGQINRLLSLSRATLHNDFHFTVKGVYGCRDADQQMRRVNGCIVCREMVRQRNSRR